MINLLALFKLFGRARRLQRRPADAIALLGLTLAFWAFRRMQARRPTARFAPR